MKDGDIRRALKHKLLFRYVHDPEVLVLDELGLQHGSIRIDVAVINGTLQGYELKSSSDNLLRLPRQSEAYNAIFDRLTLIVAKCHYQEAMQIVPQWWGLKIVEMGRRGAIHFQTIREPRDNPSPDRLAVAKLLWRQEALSLLEELGVADGVRSRPRAQIYGRLAETADIALIRSRVCRQLKSREGWRSGEQRKLGDG